MTGNERREPRFENDARLWAARLGGLAPGDRPIASGAARRRGGPLVWLLILLLVAGGWAAWRYGAPLLHNMPWLGSNGAPERESVDLVYETERVLDRLGLQPGRLDGELDPVTVDAIKLYQESAGLPVDGIPSRALLEDMRAVADGMTNEPDEAGSAN
jgi:hypothetical protein